MGTVKNICLLLILQSVCCTLHAATDTTIQLTAVKTIPGSFTSFYLDGLNNIYVLNQDNQVKKLNSNYDSAAVFNDVRRYGDIYSVDVTNPLKAIVYYKDFSTILVLDRFLNTRNTIDLRNTGILQVKAVATSYDNNYWIFDELDNKIKKLDDNGNTLLETADFRVLFQEEFNPSCIIDDGGLLYLYDAKNGWMIFDHYGGFKQKLQMKGWKDVQVENGNLLGHDDVYIHLLSPALLNEQLVKTNINLAAAIKIQKKANKLFVLTKEGLSIFAL